MWSLSLLSPHRVHINTEFLVTEGLLKPEVYISLRLVSFEMDWECHWTLT